LNFRGGTTSWALSLTIDALTKGANQTHLRWQMKINVWIERELETQFQIQTRQKEWPQPRLRGSHKIS
jgi:hypothetical protein